jgi:hypothetical protein
VEGLRREGWFPFFAVQAVPRDGERMGHAKHMLRLRRDDGIGKQEAAEVIIVNSHDGTSAYQMFAGVLRFVCTNSMIAGERFEEVRVPHKGGIQDQIIEGVYTVAEDFPRLIDATEGMKDTQLSSDEQHVLAEAALSPAMARTKARSPGPDHRAAPPRGCRAKPVADVQRHSGKPHPGRHQWTPPDFGRTHPSQPDPRHQRHRPECQPQSRPLDAGRGNAAPENRLIVKP